MTPPKTNKDKRHPRLMKIGCYFQESSKVGFKFFDNPIIKNGDVFIYNKGVLWRV